MLGEVRALRDDVHAAQGYPISREEDIVLNRLNPKQPICRFLRCYKDTRKDVRSEIDNWADLPDALNVLWIHGYPGAGKSTLAMHFADLLCQRHRLAIIVEFSRETGVTAAILWNTVAYALANEYPVCREAIVTMFA